VRGRCGALDQLPFFPQMTDGQVERVAGALSEVLRRSS